MAVSGFLSARGYGRPPGSSGDAPGGPAAWRRWARTRLRRGHHSLAVFARPVERALRRIAPHGRRTLCGAGPVRLAWAHVVRGRIAARRAGRGPTGIGLADPGVRPLSRPLPAQSAPRRP